MLKYKTILSDYEALQGILDAHGAQGWRLVSVTPDTWRKSVASKPEADGISLEDLGGNGQPLHEYTASYYLLVFAIEGEWEIDEHEAALEKANQGSSRPYFE